jgi:hypothetical protein
MKKFEIGKTYSMRSACDHDCIWTYKILKRTDKTVTLDNNKSYRIGVYEDREIISPLGKYSMSPTLRA